MATTKITNPELFDLGSLDTALKLPSGTTAERPTSPSTGEWRYNTTTNLVEFWDGGEWRDLQSEDIPPIPSENFNVVLYTGNGSTQSITGVGFKPDFVWLKLRSAAGYNHVVFDSTRGATKRIYPNDVAAENSNGKLISFDSDGFTFNGSGSSNVNGQTFVAWCWKANGGTTSSNTDGSITSTVQVNLKAGFSIINYTGNNTAGATVGHGLGSTPELIIFKPLVGAAGWKVYCNQLSDPANKVLSLQDTGAEATINAFNGTLPNSSVITLAAYGDTNRTSSIIAYAFHSVAGYSKIGSYTGNGSDNGPIVETGFEPAFVMIKRSSGTGNWQIWDNKRSTTNTRDKLLFPNDSAAEQTLAYVDFLSNGFQIVDASGATGGTNVNINGSTYIYIAFAADASAAPALPDSFANKLYTGTNAAQSITGLGFSPSFIWFKNRTGTNSHALFDSVRGNLSSIYSDLTSAANISSAGEDLTSFDSDGFSVGTVANAGSTNVSGGSIVAWNWKANSAPTINTDGTIQSVVSANQSSGFSIVKYTGTGSAGTVGHGLSAKCDMVIIKTLDSINNWIVQLPQLGDNARMLLDNTSAKSDDSTTAQAGNATVFGIGADNSVAKSGDSFIAYCFTSISGFSKIESYTGNGSTNGPIVTTGFQPDWIMIKRTDAAGTNWNIMDSLRGNSDYLLAANTNAAEVTNETPLNTTSTGFEITEASDYINASGGTYIYMAFKENPVQYAIPSGACI